MHIIFIATKAFFCIALITDNCELSIINYKSSSLFSAHVVNYRKKGQRCKVMYIRERVVQYLEYCKFRRELDDKTLKAYRIDLKQFFETVTSDEPSKGEIEEYITGLHKNYKQKTVKRKIASVKAFYNYLEEEEYIEVNPFHRIKVKFKETAVLPRIIPRNEIEQLLNYMYSGREEKTGIEKNYWLRDIAVIEVFFGTGARVYEISNIAADCVDLNTGAVKIMGKGGKERYILISDAGVLQLLREYYEKNQDSIKKSGYFFVNKRGDRFTDANGVSQRSLLRSKTAELRRLAVA